MTYAQAYDRAKIWDECRLEDDLVIYTNHTYSNNPIPPRMGTFPITIHNQYYVTDVHTSTTFNAPLQTKPVVMMSTSQDPMIAKHEDAIMNLTKNI